MPEDCSEISRNLSAGLDGELDNKDQAAVKDHLAACSACSTELNRLSAIDADIKSLPEVEPSPFFAARVIAAARAVNRGAVSLRRFLRVPVPAMAVLGSLICLSIFTFALKVNAMESGPRSGLTRKVITRLIKPASIINPVAVARLCAECSAYMCQCMHEAGKKSLCPCKDCEIDKAAI